MAKNISSVKDLVIQTITNGSEIETKAKNNDAEACFQMGMTYLLGASSSIDFKKATTYFGNQSLAGNPDANRLLGFITECEGDYSEAFKCYTKAKDTIGKDKNLPLYNKVFEERNHLQKFLKEMGLPSTALNTEVSAILGDYVKGGKSKVEASLKIATICNDESSCLEAAQTLYDRKDFYSAKKWLQKGNIASDNSLYAAISDKLAKSKKGISLPNTLEVVDIQGTSLLPDNYASNGIADIKHRCDAVAQSSKKQWLEEITSLISQIKNQLKEEEEERIRKQKEEEKRLKKQKEEEERRIRKQKEEEEKRLKKQKQEEEKRKRQAEYQAFLQEQAEEEERARKRKKLIKVIIVALCGFAFGLFMDHAKISSGFGAAFSFVVWYYVIKWYKNGNQKRKKTIKYAMIFAIFFIVLIFASMGSDSQDESAKSPVSIMLSDMADVEFKGYINNKYEIVVTISRNGSKLEGRYYYVQTMLKNGDKPSTYISLTGTVDDNGNAELIGKAVDGTEENWQGQFESDGQGQTTFQGTFHGANGKEFDISMTTSKAEIYE